MAEVLKGLRVGGTYWSAQPELPARYILTQSVEAARGVNSPHESVVLWSLSALGPSDLPGILVVTGECDPWHMLAGATAVVGEIEDDLCLFASLLGVPLDQSGTPAKRSGRGLLQDLSQTQFQNPFTGKWMNALETAELCGFWRRLIDCNREIAGAVGFAFWKQANVAPLLWGGSDPVRFVRAADEVKPGADVAVWRSKSSPSLIADLEGKDCRLVEVEDGFLRSSGLGADCVPPLSITVDRRGAYFDASQPSDLEILIKDGGYDEALLSRARTLRRSIVEAGIGKYGKGHQILSRPAGSRRHILVPGQVEDDRSVQTGGCGLVSNLDLLAKVREQSPDAYILYKPHPDVVAGHRRGAIPESACLRYADEILADLPIAPVLEMVDEVHVNTSLTGFESLLRGKPVTTYGVPFYAGWGLTNDLGAVPARRTAKRTLDELVAATLLLYPRYLDPRTGLPCPAETVVTRLGNNEVGDSSVLVGMRRFQGKLMRRLRSLVQ